jgi:hypothetical protein
MLPFMFGFWNKVFPTVDPLGCDVDLFLNPPLFVTKLKIFDLSAFGDTENALELTENCFKPSSSVFSLSVSLSCEK